MGVLLAFFVGWVVGTKSGPSGYTEVTAAVRTVKESEEFEALLSIARSHAATALHELSKLVSGETAPPDPVSLLERVQSMTSTRSS